MDENKPTIYLDYDGVLHDDDVVIINSVPAMVTPGRALFEWAPILDALFADYPAVQIILSTSWATAFGCDEAAAFLPSSLQSRVVGAIWHKDTGAYASGNYPRGVAVCTDADQRRLTNWFAIDNDDTGWPTQYREKLLKTDDRLGLSDEALSISLFMMLEILTCSGS